MYKTYQSGIRRIFSFLNPVYKRRKIIKLRITPECFGKLFAFVNDDITNYKYERWKHTKTKSCYKNISC